MKKFSMIFVAVLMMAGVSMKVVAVDTPTAATGIFAKIVVATTIHKITDLDFGTMSVPSGTTTVVLTPGGVRTNPTGSTILLPGTPVAVAASYSTAGATGTGQTYQITLPSSAITLTSGGNTVTAGTFTCSVGDGTAMALAPLTSGVGSFSVGATLTLTDGQAAGSYSGTFDVIVTTN